MGAPLADRDLSVPGSLKLCNYERVTVELCKRRPKEKYYQSSGQANPQVGRWAARDVVAWWQGVTAKKKNIGKRGQQSKTQTDNVHFALLQKWLKPPAAAVETVLDEQVEADETALGESVSHKKMAGQAHPQNAKPDATNNTTQNRPEGGAGR